MGEDQLIAAMGAVVDAAERAREALAEAVGALVEPRRLRVSGASAQQTLESMIAGDGPLLRRRAGQALSDYEHAVMAMRSVLVCTMVDVEGLSLSDASRALGVSRQMATRLYQHRAGG